MCGQSVMTFVFKLKTCARDEPGGKKNVVSLAKAKPKHLMVKNHMATSMG